MADLSVPLERLVNERKKWRKNPIPGFIARPARDPQGIENLMKWECKIPGKKGTPWEGGHYKFLLIFSKTYPSEPPICKFSPPIIHPNVEMKTGIVWTSFLCNEEMWFPNISVRDILIAVQQLLSVPLSIYPVNPKAFTLYCKAREKYEQLIKKQANRNQGMELNYGIIRQTSMKKS